MDLDAATAVGLGAVSRVVGRSWRSDTSLLYISEIVRARW
jgi:hypothetical protein